MVFDHLSFNVSASSDLHYRRNEQIPTMCYFVNVYIAKIVFIITIFGTKKLNKLK